MPSACDFHQHHIKQTGGLSAIIQTHSDFSRSLPRGLPSNLMMSGLRRRCDDHNYYPASRARPYTCCGPPKLFCLHSSQICWTCTPGKTLLICWNRVSSGVVYHKNILEALRIVQYILKPRVMLPYILCDRSIMMNKRRTNRETFSGKFFDLPSVSLPHVHGNMPSAQILAGFILFVFLPRYVPAAGLLGLLP